MGCILYISTFWQDESHLYCQCHHANLVIICAKLPSTVSVLHMWHLGRENHTLQAAFNTYRGLRDTAASRNDQVEFSYSKRSNFPSLGLWRCSCGISLGTVWTGVAKLLLEESLTKGLWLKGNTLLCPEHLHGLQAGAFLNPTCQQPPGSEECALHSTLGAQHARRWHPMEGWRKRALVNHLKYTIILQGVDKPSLCFLFWSPTADASLVLRTNVLFLK